MAARGPGGRATPAAMGQAEGSCRPGPSRKAMWRRHRALRRQQEAGTLRRSGSPSLSELRQIPPDLHGLCFRCFEDGQRRQDYIIPLLCIRCGGAGHISSQCLEAHNPISADELRCIIIARVARKEAASRQPPVIRRRLMEPRKSAPAVSLSPVAPNLLTMALGIAPSPSPSEICVL